MLRTNMEIFKRLISLCELSMHVNTFLPAVENIFITFRSSSKSKTTEGWIQDEMWI